MNLKNDIIEALKTATEPMDRIAIAKQCMTGTDKQVADQLYLLKKAGEIIGDKQGGGSYLYRMPDARDVVSLPAELNARMAEEVDEIELERIEAAAGMKKHEAERQHGMPGTISVEALERIAHELEYDEYEAAKLINGSKHEQPENVVSETVEEAIAEPIDKEVPPFRVGVYSDGTMVLERTDEDLYGIDKAEFAVMVAFARTVGWLPA